MASYIDSEGRTFDFSAINNCNDGGTYQKTYWVHKGTSINVHTAYDRAPNRNSPVSFDDNNLNILKGTHDAAWEALRERYQNDYYWAFGSIDEGGICFGHNGTTCTMFRVLAYDIATNANQWRVFNIVPTQVTLEDTSLADNNVYLVDTVYHEGVLQSQTNNDFYLLCGRYTVTLRWVTEPVQGYERTYFGALDVIAGYNGANIIVPQLDVYPYLYLSQGGKSEYFNFTDGLGNVADDPFDGGGTSTGGGGGGDHDDTSIDIKFPGLPSNKLLRSGVIKIFNPSDTEMSQFINYIYSSADSIITNFKKLWVNPMDSIISFGIVPCAVAQDTAINVSFCGQNTGISMHPIVNEHVLVDCGSLTVKKYFNSFWDNNGYTKIKLYLPFVQYVELNPDEVIGSTIHVYYSVDVFTGECVAYVAITKNDSNFRISMDDNILYQFKGNVLKQAPVTGNSYGALYSGIINTFGGIATGNYTQAIGNIVQAATTEKVSTQRSGSVSGNAGQLGVLKPYVIVERPVQNVPANWINYHGYRSNVYTKLSAMRRKGFYMVQKGSVYLNNFGYMTDQEYDELINILETGVYDV